MEFSDTPLADAVLISLNRLEDDRGFFARSYCDAEFAAQGLCTQWPQCNVSYNKTKGTLRGMHWQVHPHGEVKLVRCTAGAIFDVIVDVRPHSPTYKQHFGVELSAENRNMLYIPEGFAHGFLTLADNTEVFYQMGSPYVPEAARTARWNDPAFNISWPDTLEIIADKDRDAPDFEG